MNFRLIALAAMAATTGMAQAAITPAQIDTARSGGSLKEFRIFGASAQQRMVGSYMQSICTADYTTYFDTTAGSNHRAYACTLNKKVGSYNAGTLVLVNKRDAGGSVFGVNPIAEDTTQNAMQVTDAGCATTGQNSDVNVAAYTCGTVALQKAHAGLSDVEPARFSDTVKAHGSNIDLNLPLGNDDNGQAWGKISAKDVKNLDIAGVNQTLFGIAVNVNLRNAMQTAQGLNAGSDAAADVPSMPRAFYAAAISGFVKGGSSNANWKALTGIAGDESKQVNICRRANGSGTQASSNLFFLNAATINDEADGMLFPLTATGALAVNGTIAVVEATSTGTVETCLTNSVLGSAGYAMGIVSYEIDPGSKLYRFVKIDGASPDKALARTGGYPYVYTATMQFNKKAGLTSDQKSFIGQFRTELASPAIIATLDPSPRKGVLGSPNSYAGNCANATGVNRTDGSCVERLDFKSAYNVNSYVNGGSASKNFATNSSQSLHVVK